MIKQGFLLRNTSKKHHKPSIPESADQIVWSGQTATTFVAACLEVLDYRSRKDLERRVRSGTGTEDKALIDGCCGNHHHDHSDENSHVHGGHNKPHIPPPYKFQKDTDDNIGKLLDEAVGHDKLLQVAAKVAERGAEVWNNVRQKGEEEGLELGPPEEKHLRREVLREALIREIQLQVGQNLRREHQAASLEGGLLALPAGYRDGPLDSLLPETLSGLMRRGVGIQYNYMGEQTRKQICKELELREFDGAMSELVQHQMAEMRKYRCCWLTAKNLDRQSEPGLQKLLSRMVSIPFELNKKASLSLQANAVFQVSCFPESSSFFKKHYDGSFGDDDVGRKITALYFPNPQDWTEADGGFLRVFTRRSKTLWDEEQRKAEQVRNRTNCPDGGAKGDVETEVECDIAPGPDTLVLIRSRDVAVEVLECHRKRFDVCLWISGPVGPGDDI